MYHWESSSRPAQMLPGDPLQGTGWQQVGEINEFQQDIFLYKKLLLRRKDQSKWQNERQIKNTVLLWSRLKLWPKSASGFKNKSRQEWNNLINSFDNTGAGSRDLSSEARHRVGKEGSLASVGFRKEVKRERKLCLSGWAFTKEHLQCWKQNQWEG